MSLGAVPDCMECAHVDTPVHEHPCNDCVGVLSGRMENHFRRSLSDTGPQQQVVWRDDGWRIPLDGNPVPIRRKPPEQAPMIVIEVDINE